MSKTPNLINESPNFQSVSVEYFSTYFQTFGALILQFVLPICLMFAFFYTWKNQPFKNSKIKKREPIVRFIWHEVRYSVLSFILLTFFINLDTFLLKQNFTKGYGDINQYGIGYFVFSIAALLLIYDLYFYVVHRLLHHKNLYKLIHSLHHRSPTITPFGAFSISFWEGFFEFIFLPTIIFLMPLHSLALVIFLTIYIIFNAYIHSGFEILPRFWVKTPFKFLNSAFHHDFHHSKLKCNFGLFTNIWDRLFGTQMENYEAEFLKIKEESQT